MKNRCDFLTPLATGFVLVLLTSIPASAAEQNKDARLVETEKQTLEVAKSTIVENRVETVTYKQKSIVERLKPGDELQSALKRIATEHKMKAGVIISAVGSLSVASLRLAGANEATTIAGPLEVVSITGTLSDKSMHVHVSASDSTGKTIGGHLMNGCKVFTTIELVILDLSDEWTFDRQTDDTTKYLELDPQHSRL
jgi:predicted DNA-binding protein with PD1-like motif